MIAQTPKAPYYAVIFTSISTKTNTGYNATASLMEELAKKQKGFLGIESTRNEIGITVSYWESLENIQHWKLQIDHTKARAKGKSEWYQQFKVRICKVERDYGFEK